MSTASQIIERSIDTAKNLLVIAGILAANFMVGALIILMIGSDPLVAFSALVRNSLGDPVALTNVLTRLVPLSLAGLAIAVAFTAGIYNLGGEGQIYLGAFAAAWAGFTFVDLPAVLLLPLVMIASILAGAVGALIPGWLKVRFKVDEVISTLLLNTIYILFTGYLANYPFRDPARWSGTTPQIAEGAKLPVIFPATGLNAGIVIALLAVVVVYLVMNKTDIGYRWKMIGLNSSFARYGGVDIRRDQLIAMVFSGGLAGLAGGALVAGSQYRFWAQIGGGAGWDGILIALLASNQPFGVLIAGFLFAVVKTGSLAMEQASSVPSELTNVLLALLILIVTGRGVVRALLSRTRGSAEKGI